VFCDDGTTDVLRNTRTIAGSRLSTWYTNSNNLHVEHHVNMRIPMQRLPGEGERLRHGATHVERGYWEFYTGLARQIRRIRRERREQRSRQGAAA
jgi:fatty acid desaturase